MELARKMEEIYEKHPFYGSRRMAEALSRAGTPVGRKCVIELMRRMGMHGIAPGPVTSKPHLRHKTYPYLLKDVDVSSPNHVWSTDITYIPTRFGFMYLTAIVDWYSRRVLSYRLSNTMGVDFCVDALKEALQNFGTPEIFNSDQGGAVHIGGLHWPAEGEGHCHKHGWKRTCIRQHLHGALLAKPQVRMAVPELL